MEFKEFKARAIKHSPDLVIANKVRMVAGNAKSDQQRIKLRVEDVESFKNNCESFPIMFNSVNGEVNIEFHEPRKGQILPISTFVNTGFNKECAFCILSPFTEIGRQALSQLQYEDILFLSGLLKELIIHFSEGSVVKEKGTELVQDVFWISRFSDLLEGLKQFVVTTQNDTSQVNMNANESRLHCTKLSIIQNKIAPGNEHLAIRLKNLALGSTKFDTYFVKIGAKQISQQHFSEFGSVEFRALANNQAPLASWPPATSDKWGPKLVLNFPKTLTSKHTAILNTLSQQDLFFIEKLLEFLAENLLKSNIEAEKINWPLSKWQGLIISMAEKLRKLQK
jgi:hypothetical protein